MQPLARLYEREDLPAYELPPALSRRYGGSIGFVAPRLISNFVSSLDGVVAIPSVANAPSFISGGSEQDRFVMGLLRACTGAVLIGAETLRAEPEHRWTPSHIFPDAAEDLAALRRGLGLPPEPKLAVLTSSGNLDPAIPALDGALIITGPEGARAAVARGLPAEQVIEVGSGGAVPPAAAVDALRARGHHVVLSEAGPNFTAQLLSEGLLDELFLTISPVVVGRHADEARPGFAQGPDLLTAGPPSGDLLSVRRGDGHLFLRYALDRR